MITMESNSSMSSSSIMDARDMKMRSMRDRNVRPSSKSHQPPARLQHSSSKYSTTSSHKKTVSFSNQNATIKNRKQKERHMAPVDRAAEMKQSRRKSRKKQLQKAQKQQQHPIEQVAGETSRHLGRVPPEVNVANDDATFTTYHSGTQVSGMTAAYSVATGGGYACRPEDLGLPWLSSEGLHDRIQHEMEKGEQNEGKGTRLTHLNAKKKEGQQGEIDSSACGKTVPSVFQGTLKTVKDHFRSEALEEGCCGEGGNGQDSSATMASRLEELTTYTNRAKETLLDTIDALEHLRVTTGEKLSPAIERLRIEAESACSDNDGWCKENYVRLESTTSELHREVARVTLGCCGVDQPKLENNNPDPPDADDVSIVHVETMPEEKDFSRSADQAMLKNLREAAATFLLQYKALTSTLPPFGSTKKEEEEAPVEAKASGDAQDGGLIGAVVSASGDDIEISEDTEDSQEVEVLMSMTSTSFFDGPQEPDGVKLKKKGCPVEPKQRHLYDPNTSPELAKKQGVESQDSCVSSYSMNSVDSSKVKVIHQEEEKGWSIGEPIKLDDLSTSSFRKSSKCDETEAARLEQESVAVWKKLKKLSKKKRKAAVSALGNVIDGIDQDSTFGSSSESVVSAGTQGTLQNPIVLVEESEAIQQRPSQDPEGSVKRSATPSSIPLSRRAEKLLALEEHSIVSGLTSITGLKSQTSSPLTTGAVVVEDEPRKETDLEKVLERVEAAEHLLSSFKTHMRYRKTASDVSEGESESSEKRAREVRRIEISEDSSTGTTPSHRQHLFLSKDYLNDEDEVTHPPTINLLDAPSTFDASESFEDAEKRGVFNEKKPTKLLADPNRHGRIGTSNWDPFTNTTSVGHGDRIRAEERDDQHHVSVPAHDYNKPDGRQDDSSHSWLYKDQRYGAKPPSGIPPRPKVSVFRDPAQPDTPGVQDSFSSTRSTTSSFMDKSIPRRSKSVSFCLPGDESFDDSISSVSKGGVSASNGPGPIALSSRALAHRSSIARRELARMSQRQASLIARGAPHKKQSIDP